MPLASGISVTQILLFLYLLLEVTMRVIFFIQILRSDFPGNRKMLWMAVNWFAPFGWMFYLLVGRRQRILPAPPPTPPSPEPTFFPGEQQQAPNPRPNFQQQQQQQQEPVSEGPEEEAQRQKAKFSQTREGDSVA